MRKRILVVDDDELLLAALGGFLLMEGFDTQAVSRAVLVDDAVAAFKPDLIVMDIMLDTADGRIICDRLKSDAGTSHIPIILLTGLSYSEIAEIDCKADAIVGKPYDRSLMRTIGQLLKSF
jgi:DNA-binding response OmpR family regulator